MDEPQLMVGSRIGPYTVGPQIGAGGLGAVYAATGPEGTVAIKVLHAGRLNPAIAASLVAEFETARRAAGPGVVRMRAAAFDHEPPYLVMDLVDAIDVHQWRRTNGPLAGPVLERFAASLLTAMSHIHLAGIVHGDLKPTNVLVSDNGTAHVVDFGLAALATGDHTGGPSTPGQGTPGWRAPEVEAGEVPTIAADVYGWGRVVDYAANGHLPESLRAKVDAATSTDIARRRAAYVPPAFPVPDTLPPTASPPPVPATEPPPSTRRSHRRWLVAMGILLAITLLGIGYATFLVDPSGPATLAIYDDGFVNGFTLNAFNGTNDPASTADRRFGSTSLATTPTAYDGFMIWLPDGVPLNEFDILQFWIRVADGDTTPIQVAATTKINSPAGRGVEAPGVVPGRWSRVTVSLDSLITDRAAFATATERMIWFSSPSPDPRPTIFVDNITLVAADP